MNAKSSTDTMPFEHEHKRERAGERRLMRAEIEVLTLNKLKGLTCQNDADDGFELQGLFGALSNRAVVLGLCFGLRGMIQRDRSN